MENSINKLLIGIISAAFILLFLYAATSKLLDQQRFLVVISQSPLLTTRSQVISWSIPMVEIFISILLIVPAFKVWGMILSFGLMAIFTFYIAYMLMTSSDLPCSCGGVLNNMNWTNHLLFNIFFTIIAFYGMVLLRRNKTTYCNKTGEAENLQKRVSTTIN